TRSSSAGSSTRGSRPRSTGGRRGSRSRTCCVRRTCRRGTSCAPANRSSTCSARSRRSRRRGFRAWSGARGKGARAASGRTPASARTALRPPPLHRSRMPPMPSPYGELTVIVNPHAGRRRVGEEVPELERTLRSRGLPYRLLRTEGPGDATRFASETFEAGGRFVVAVGGDGTVHEVVNGQVDDQGKPLVPRARP